jgi:hypothetical protein
MKENEEKKSEIIGQILETRHKAMKLGRKFDCTWGKNLSFYLDPDLSYKAGSGFVNMSESRSA